MSTYLLTIALLLARTCVAEIGLVPDGVQECQLMWTINAINAEKRGRTWQHQTKLNNSYWRVPEKRELRPWIGNLTDEKRPRGWPRNLDWEKSRGAWLLYLAAAKKFVTHRGPIVHPCPGAMDYGGPREFPAMRLVRMECLNGNTKQWYWRWRRKAK